ncbi:hypothetical protein SLE2022_097880 [Rubroshorea leprosula]
MKISFAPTPIAFTIYTTSELHQWRSSSLLSLSASITSGAISNAVELLSNSAYLSMALTPRIVTSSSSDDQILLNTVKINGGLGTGMHKISDQEY